jgi:CheY-like chemotaxis protein
LQYDVTEAADGYAALRSVSAEEESYDLIMMDIIMPDKEGIETIMEIRKKDAGEDRGDVWRRQDA